MTLKSADITDKFESRRLSIARWADWFESRNYLLPLMLLAMGAAWRIWWVHGHFDTLIKGEAGRVAVAFARTGAIADPFYPGEGPTTHLSPIAPMINGLILRVLGVETAESTWALTLFAIACCLGAAIILYQAFAIIGVSRRSRLAGLGLACLLPLNELIETDEFRFWEGGLAVLLSASIFWLTVKADRKDELRFADIVLLSFLLSLLFFISLPLGLAGYVNLAVLLLRRAPVRRWAGMITTAALLLMVVLAPWTIRNYNLFGHFIPLRGNAGLELAVANHPAALNDVNPRGVFRARLAEIHPDEEPAVFRKMQQEGGEIPYAARLGRETVAWIKQHPADFTRLTIRHLTQFFFPPRWLWTVNSKRERGIDIRKLITWTTAAFGLAGVLACLFWWRERMLYAVAIVTVPALPYMVLQPILRYRYIILFPLLYLCTEFVHRLWCLSKKRSLPSSHL